MPSFVRYAVMQLERAPETGTVHLQGYLQFFVRQHWSRVKSEMKWLDKAHFENAKGSAESNRVYCTKTESRLEGTEPYEYGEMEMREDKGNEKIDMEEVRKRIRETGSIKDVPAKIVMRHPAGLKMLMSECEPPFRANFKVLCIVGSTGIGKSHWAAMKYPHAGRAHYGNCGMWFTNVSADTEVVIFDDFLGQVPLQTALIYFDKFPMYFEVKGGMVPAMKYRLCVITSNSVPDIWYPVKADDRKDRTESVKALLRRVGASVEYPDVSRRFVYATTREQLEEQLENIEINFIGDN